MQSKNRVYRLLLLLFFATMLTASTLGHAEDQSTGETTPVSTAQKADSIPMVVAIHVSKLSDEQEAEASKFKLKADKDSSHLCVAYPNTTLRFTITYPAAFLATRPNDQAKVVIYLNGNELKGLGAAWESSVTAAMIRAGQMPKFGKTEDIYIQLKRGDTISQAAWNALYSDASYFLDNNVLIHASIGWEGMSQLSTSPHTSLVQVVFYYSVIFWLWIGLLAVLVGGFITLGITTNVIREGGKEGPYSLSLTQLMFWTVLVIAAFIYTMVLTDIPSGFNTSVLLMLGISVSTTGAASFIDNRFKKENVDVKKPSRGFIRDIFTVDGYDYSVQRIQAAAWNLVLALYFIIFTIVNKRMPEFNSTVLFLAGITSVAYISSKGPENDTLKQQQTNTATEPVG
jgi:hypothetical protein